MLKPYIISRSIKNKNIEYGRTLEDVCLIIMRPSSVALTMLYDQLNHINLGYLFVCHLYTLPDHLVDKIRIAILQRL